MKIKDLKNKILENVQLDEDLGTLNQIKPEMRDAILGDEPTRGTYRHGRNDNKKKQKPGRLGNKNLGAESSVNKIDVTSAKDACDALFSDNSGVLGFVMVVGPAQILSIGKTSSSYRGESGEYKITLYLDLIKRIAPENADAVLKDINSKKNVYIRAGTQDAYATTGKISASVAKHIINTIFKLAKSQGMKISALLIGTDKNRQTKQGERQAAIAGAEAIAVKSDRFKEQAKRSLRDRLEKFKSQKAEQYKTPQEFMAAAIQKGFMDKVNIDGFIYNIQNDTLRIKDIIKPDNWNTSNRIKYHLDTSHSEKLDAIKQQMWDLKRDEKDNPALDVKIEELRNKLPPRDISIVLGMQGGMIVPTDVIVSDDRGSYY